VTEQQVPAVVVASGDTWSVKEVYGELKSDIMGRFDKQDDRLESIDRRLDSMATKDDVTQLHQRIDGVEARIVPLESGVAREVAIESNRSRKRATLAWAAGILASAAIVAGLVINFLH